MARKSPAPAPAPQPSAPPPAELLTGPRLFARALAPTPPRAWRYLAVVGLSSLLSGVAYAALLRRAGLGSPIVDALGGTFLGGLTFLLLWGLGRLGSGKAGRAGEVYGATFALLAPLYLLSIVWTLLTPAAAFVPSPELVAAAGDAQRAALRAAAQTQAAFLLLLVSVGGVVGQCGLAFFAFRELTGRVGAAVLGAALPLLPALIVQFVGIAPLIVGR